MSSKTTKRTITEKQKLENRLKIIEGQVRGVSAMIEEERYCSDILIQISAITKSLQSLANIILENHIKTCVVRDLKADNLDVIDELINLIRRMQ